MMERDWYRFYRTKHLPLLPSFFTPPLPLTACTLTNRHTYLEICHIPHVDDFFHNDPGRHSA